MFDFTHKQNISQRLHDSFRSIDFYQLTIKYDVIRPKVIRTGWRYEGMGARVHLFIQFISTDDQRWVGRSFRATKRREREFAISSPGLDQSYVPGDISGLFSSRLVASFGIEDSHLATTDSSCRVSKLQHGRMWLVLHPFGRRASVAILHELVVRQENIALHGRAIRFFCWSRVRDSDEPMAYAETTYFIYIPVVRYSYYN